MSRTVIDVSSVLGLNSLIQSSRTTVGNVNYSLSALQHQVDGKILAKHRLLERLQSVSGQLSEIEQRMNRIRQTVERGANLYQNTELQVQRWGDDLGRKAMAVGSFGLGLGSFSETNRSVWEKPSPDKVFSKPGTSSPASQKAGQNFTAAVWGTLAAGLVHLLGNAKTTAAVAGALGAVLAAGFLFSQGAGKAAGFRGTVSVFEGFFPQAAKGLAEPKPAGIAVPAAKGTVSHSLSVPGGGFLKVGGTGLTAQAGSATGAVSAGFGIRWEISFAKEKPQVKPESI